MAALDVYVAPHGGLKFRTPKLCLTAWRSPDTLAGPGVYHGWVDKIEAMEDIVTKGSTRKVVFAAGKEEICPSTGRDHMHIYLVLDSAIDGETFKAWTKDPTVHIEKRLGSHAQALTYVEKEETKKVGGRSFKVGDDGMAAKGQGKRTDLDDIHEMIVAGTTKRRICEEHFGSMVRYGRGIERAMAIMGKQTNAFCKKDVTILWGQPNTNKTRFARTVLIGDALFVEPARNNAGALSFENASGDEDFILMDEFTGGVQMSVDVIKQITDGYSVIMPGRGSSVLMKHRGVILLSNADPSTWWPHAAPAHMEAFYRRCSRIYECRSTGWKWAHPSLPGANLPVPRWDATTNECSIHLVDGTLQLRPPPAQLPAQPDLP